MKRERIRICYYVAVIIVGIFSIVAFLWVVQDNGTVITQPDVSSSFLTAISIIVALGIGYSIINIHAYSSKVDNLEERLRKFELNTLKALKEVEDAQDKKLQEHIDGIAGQLRELEHNYFSAKHLSELNKRNMDTNSKFSKGEILQALKGEYDSLCYIFTNYKFFNRDFDSHTGSKRALMSNDLLEIERKFDEEYLNKLQSENLIDITSTILKDIAILRESEANSLLNQFEKERFNNIYKASESIIVQIQHGQKSIVIEPWLRAKLVTYSKIIEGNKPD